MLLQPFVRLSAVGTILVDESSDVVAQSGQVGIGFDGSLTMREGCVNYVLEYVRDP